MTRRLTQPLQRSATNTESLSPQLPRPFCTRSKQPGEATPMNKRRSIFFFFFLSPPPIERAAKCSFCLHLPDLSGVNRGGGAGRLPGVDLGRDRGHESLWRQRGRKMERWEGVRKESVCMPVCSRLSKTKKRVGLVETRERLSCCFRHQSTHRAGYHLKHLDTRPDRKPAEPVVPKNYTILICTKFISCSYELIACIFSVY